MYISLDVSYYVSCSNETRTYFNSIISTVMMQLKLYQLLFYIINKMYLVYRNTFKFQEMTGLNLNYFQNFKWNLTEYRENA